MTRRILIAVAVVLALCLMSFGPSGVNAAVYSFITKDQLNAELTKPDVTLLDVRAPMNWMFSTSKIQGAVREDPRDVATWKDKYPKDKPLVLYCQTDVTSSGVAQQLVSHGFTNVYVLKGGWGAWSEAHLPSEKK